MLAATELTVAVAVVNAATVLAVAEAGGVAAMALTVAGAGGNVAMAQTVAVADISPLKLADGILHFERNNKHLFFVPDIPNWMVVNKNSAILLFSCDGTKTEDEICNTFAIQEHEREDVRSLFNEGLKRNVLQGSGSSNALSSAVACACANGCSNDIGKGSLRTVYLKLTDECNLRCNYCYASSGKPSEILTIDVLRRILKEVSDISKSVEYVLSGGEPLLHPHILDFAEEAARAGNDVQLLTNGAFIDNDEIARRIATTTKLVKISVDGSTDILHSISRGQGNFDKVTKAIDLLSHHGANVQVAMTVTKNNVNDIANMSARYGSRLTLQPLFKAGRGKGKDNIELTGEEYYRAMECVDGVAPMGNLARTLESIRGRGVKKCALAEREISISETGDVYPCQLLHAPEFLGGNIYKNSLADIYYTSPVLKKMRLVSVDTIDECSKCPIRLICAGGCRARDYYESGSVESVGEFCEYEKLAFINGILDYSSFDA